MSLAALSDIHSKLSPLGEKLGLSWAQKEAHRGLILDSENGERKLYLDIAMGAGKSAVTLAYMEACYTAGVDAKAYMLCSSDAQVRNLLENEAPIWAPELCKSGKLTRFLPSKASEASDFLVATYSAGIEGLEKKILRKPDFLFLDEGHAALSSKRQKVLNSLGNDTLQIALTATPAYKSGKSLPAMGYKESYRLPFDVAVARSLLCSYRNILVEVTDPDVSLDDVEIINGDYDLNALDKMVRHHSVMKALKGFIDEWRDPDTGSSILEKKVMISCPTVSTAIFFQNELNRTYSNRMAPGVKVAEAIWAQSQYAGIKSKHERERIIARHRNRETRILTTQDYLLTGHNDKEIDVVINLRPTASMVLVPQRGGRAMRYNPENPDKVAHIIDVIFKGDMRPQRLFAEYAGGSEIWTEEARKKGYHLKPKLKPQDNYPKGQEEDIIPPPPFNIYREDTEIRKFIVDKKIRTAIAKRPWLAQATPTLLEHLIREDISTFNHLVKRIREIEGIEGWNDDFNMAKGKGGNLSEPSLKKAFSGGYMAERMKENHIRKKEFTKEWKSVERELREAIKGGNAKLAELLEREKQNIEYEARRPAIEEYHVAEVALSRALKVHPSKLFGDIKHPKKEIEGTKTRLGDKGEIIKIIPEGVSTMRTPQKSILRYEPDHLFPNDYLEEALISGREVEQSDFTKAFTNAVAEELEDLIAVDDYDIRRSKDPYCPPPSHEEQEEIIRSIIETLTNNTPVEEGRIRRHHGRTKGNLHDFSITRETVSAFSVEFEEAARSEFPAMETHKNGGSTFSLLTKYEDPSNKIDREKLSTTLSNMLTTLSPRQERVLRLRFGLGSGNSIENEHTLEQVGSIFDVTRERVRQMEAKALRTLKHPSRARVLRQFL